MEEKKLQLYGGDEVEVISLLVTFQYNAAAIYILKAERIRR